MQFPVLIGLHRSFLFDRIFLVLCLLLTLGVFLYPVDTLLRSAFLVLLCLGFVRTRRFFAPPFVQLRLQKDGAFLAQCRNSGDWLHARGLPGMFVHPWLTVIRLQTEDGRQFSLPVTVDSMSPEDFRRLRVFLRWQFAASVPDVPA